MVNGRAENEDLRRLRDVSAVRINNGSKNCLSSLRDRGQSLCLFPRLVQSTLHLSSCGETSTGSLGSASDKRENFQYNPNRTTRRESRTEIWQIGLGARIMVETNGRDEGGRALSRRNNVELWVNKFDHPTIRGSMRDQYFCPNVCQDECDCDSVEGIFRLDFA